MNKKNNVFGWGPKKSKPVLKNMHPSNSICNDAGSRWSDFSWFKRLPMACFNSVAYKPLAFCSYSKKHVLSFTYFIILLHTIVSNSFPPLVLLAHHCLLAFFCTIYQSFLKTLPLKEYSNYWFLLLGMDKLNSQHDHFHENKRIFGQHIFSIPSLLQSTDYNKKGISKEQTERTLLP